MHFRPSAKLGFTLIELLVVIAIIAILTVVVVLTLNPAELLRQSRDSNRVADMATISNALNLYNIDQGSATSFSLGSSTVVYPSLADAAATSTAGTNCANLNLLSIPATYSYHCPANSTWRLVNGTGWIPVNLNAISSGAPIGSLPVDPTNNSSSRLYYSYITNGSQFETTASMESQKYKIAGTGDVISPDGGTLAVTYEKGTKLGLMPIDYGDPTLVGYWPLNEGTGTAVYDESGNGNSSTWSGAGSGTNGHYSPGQIWPWAGAFDGGSNYVLISNIPGGFLTHTITAWVSLTSTSTANTIIENYTNQNYRFSLPSAANINDSGLNVAYAFSLNTWTFVASSYDGTTERLYVNGTLVGSGVTGRSVASTGAQIGTASPPNYQNFSGLIQNLRLYNRALSTAEIQALYNAGK